ncbi:unnamed protein product [Peronospora belbahrii]|uniref:Uncharacterized protein n=1 Tax=Peronospora belbahrii TaxID=622444 RepID=A0ABN8CTM1_9STRA|nr:unnamed protein product [Peronospora belbahrii]
MTASTTIIQNIKLFSNIFYILNGGREGDKILANCFLPFDIDSCRRWTDHLLLNDESWMMLLDDVAMKNRDRECNRKALVTVSQTLPYLANSAVYYDIFAAAHAFDIRHHAIVLMFVPKPPLHLPPISLLMAATSSQTGSAFSTEQFERCNVSSSTSLRSSI